MYTVPYGSESLSFMGPKICKLVPKDIKYTSSIEKFKHKIKLWEPTKCPCRLYNLLVLATLYKI